jgi:UDP-galactopyranose mutase
MIEYLVVGAGFSGATIAERIASILNKKVLVIDKRNHIGGNAYDSFSSNGVLYHNYGPHYFRTNSDLVLNYLSKFTQWIDAEYNIQVYDKGEYFQFPINLNTISKIQRKEYTEEMFKKYLEINRIPCDYPQNSEELILSIVGWKLYEKFYKNYTFKQWKKYPKDLDPSVCGRVPIRTNHDNRYFNDKYQCLPKNGYTELIGNMLHYDNIELQLRTSLQDIDIKQFKYIFYTGPIDEYFQYKYGELPYRSLRFDHHNFNDIGLKQQYVQINYPNEFDYTRTVEIKHITKQNTKNTVVSYEYPDDWKIGKEPYYPIPCKESVEIYKLYENESKLLYPKVVFLRHE